MPAEYARAPIRFGLFQVDFQAGELRKNGVKLPLQDQPFRVLALLLSRPGALVTREELRQALWPADTFVDFDRNLNKAINKLRGALGDSAAHPLIIETVPRHGYRFIAEVRPLVASPPEHETESPLARPAIVRSRIAFRSRWLAVAALALLGIAGTAFYARNALTSSLAQNPRPSVAVLGFQNLSGRPSEGWLSTALADWLRTELAMGGQVRAIPAAAVARMRLELPLPNVGSLDRPTLARIRRNLGADLVVTGSYAVLGTGPGAPVRLDLQLEDARKGAVLAAFPEVGSEGRLFDLVSRAGTALRNRLGLAAVPAPDVAAVRASLPSNELAARDYAEGLSALRVFDPLVARTLLERAAREQPDSALTHSALAMALAALGYDHAARQEAQRSLALAARLDRAQRLLIEGRYRELSHQWGDAVRIYQRLYAFYPDDVDYGLDLARAQVQNGQGGEALATVAALEKLPLPLSADPRIALAGASAAESQGDFKTDADFAAAAARAARGAGAGLLLAQALMAQAWAEENLGAPGDAIAKALAAGRIYAEARDRRGQAQAATVHAIALQMLGRLEQARGLYAQALAAFQQIGNQDGAAASWNNLGAVLRAMGELNAADRDFAQSAAIYRALGHEDGLALTQANHGDVALELGSLADAAQSFQRALTIARRLRDRSKAALALAGLGSVAAKRGDWTGAERADRQALAAYAAIGDRKDEAEVRLSLGRVLLAQGNAAAAAAAAAAASAEFSREGLLAGLAQAQALRARSWAMRGQLAAARQAIAASERAGAHSQDRETRWRLLLARAQIQALAVNGNAQAAALRDLALVRQEAADAGFRYYVLSARLTAGLIGLHQDSNPAARRRLLALERDASRQGYLGIARRVAQALGGEHGTAGLNRG